MQVRTSVSGLDAANGVGGSPAINIVRSETALSAHGPGFETSGGAKQGNLAALQLEGDILQGN